MKDILVHIPFYYVSGNCLTDKYKLTYIKKLTLNTSNLNEYLRILLKIKLLLPTLTGKVPTEVEYKKLDGTMDYFIKFIYNPIENTYFSSDGKIIDVLIKDIQNIKKDKHDLC